jgi:hypothetical protein
LVVFAEEETAVTDVRPWSGYWWPIKQGWMWGEEAPSTDCSNLSSEFRAGPLNKYDLVATARSAGSERLRKHSPDAECWWGYCHAWAAASVLEPEPTADRLIRVGNRQMRFTVGDQKALLSVCYDEAPADFHGQRFNDPEIHDLQDLAPEVLWGHLQFYIRDNNTPVILDTEAGQAVWNYPAFAYGVRYEPTDDPGVYVARMEVAVADDAVDADYVGTQIKTETYFFAFRVADGAIVEGSGQWLNESRQVHPDFAWYPKDIGIANPEVDYSIVREIVGTNERSRGSERSRGEEKGQSAPLEVAITRGNRLEISRGEGPALIGLSALEVGTLLAAPASSAGLKLSLADADSPSVGKEFSCSVTSDRPGYLYLFTIDGGGDVKVLFPLEGKDNKIAAGKPFTVGGEADKLLWAGPPGKQQIKAVVTGQPLSLGRLEPAGRNQAGAGRQLHWTPSERTLVSSLLAHPEKSAEAVDKKVAIDLNELLGEFAAAEVSVDVKPAK